MAAEAESQAHQNPSEPSREEEEDDKPKAVPRPRLRRLELVRIAAARAVVCLVALYGLAKSRAGTHRPKVDTVESVVGRVVGPVYARFRGTPLVLLVFLDRKVDEMVLKLDRKLRSSLKAASSRAYAAAQAAPGVAKELLATGADHASRSAYVKKVAQVAVPAAVHWAEKYNRAVAGSRCIPRVPTKLIAKFFTDRGVEVEVNDAR
ncbi:hypothetical protein QYE76_067940 [Lolium multiflorum]|uniref:Uncharacterized protein n=1 Tax=Lolium multiflorum TaxID=4521 RepID=A0AAD8WC52_LOLMU|nr:hypothetical protein QYE76_067940 [Lolium multiflorum]